MKKIKKQTSNAAESGKKQGANQTLQKNLVTKVTRLFLALVVTLIAVSGVFMYFSNMNTLHEMANVTLKSTSSAVEQTLHLLRVYAVSVQLLPQLNRHCIHSK